MRDLGFNRKQQSNYVILPMGKRLCPAFWNNKALENLELLKFFPLFWKLLFSFLKINVPIRKVDNSFKLTWKILSLSKTCVAWFTLYFVEKAIWTWGVEIKA